MIPINICLFLILAGVTLYKSIKDGKDEALKLPFWSFILMANMWIIAGYLE